MTATSRPARTATADAAVRPPAGQGGALGAGSVSEVRSGQKQPQGRAQSIVIDGFPPVVLARTLSPNGRVHWAQRNKAKDLVAIHVHKAAANLMWMRGPVRVTFRYTVPTRHRRDLDNLTTGVAKACLDTLVRGGWLEDDDSQHVVSVTAEVVYEKGQRRLEIVLAPAAAPED